MTGVIFKKIMIIKIKENPRNHFALKESGNKMQPVIPDWILLLEKIILWGQLVKLNWDLCGKGAIVHPYWWFAFP